jgi:Tol biopolymer transport system component
VVTVNGTGYPTGSNAGLTVRGLAPGLVEVGLAGIAGNCLVTGENPVTISVAAGATAATSFAVQCAPSADGRLLVVSDRDGRSGLYLLREDGSDLRDLAPTQEVYAGDWSPDGTRIVFSAAAGGAARPFVMDADGSGVVGLGVAGSGPRWSPDGRTIAFTSDDGITLVDPDGAHRRVLGEGRNPDWSPDGTAIAFDRTDRSRCVADLACPVELFTIKPDGTDVRRLIRVTDFSDGMTAPRWSPDGTAIAFARRCCFLGPDLGGLYVLPAGGGAIHRIHPGRVRGSPVWSPDASSVAAPVAGLDGTTDILVVPRAGGLETQLLATPGSDYPQAWR